MQSSCLIPGTEIPVTLAYQRVVDSPDLYTKAIKFWTRQEQIHVEIIVGDIWLSSTLGKGVRVKPLGPLKPNYVHQKVQQKQNTAINRSEISQQSEEEENHSITDTYTINIVTGKQIGRAHV